MITRSDLQVMRQRGYRRYGWQREERPKAWERCSGELELTIHIIGDSLTLQVTRWGFMHARYGSFAYRFRSVRELLDMEERVIGCFRTMLEVFSVCDQVEVCNG